MVQDVAPYRLALGLTVSLAVAVGARPGSAQSTDAAPWAQDPPSLASLVAFDRGQSDLRVAVDRYREDRSALFRRWDVPYSPNRRERLRGYYREWQRSLADLDFDALNHEGQIDYVLLRTQLAFELAMLDQEAVADAEMAPLVPFAQAIGALQEARRDRKDVDPRAARHLLRYSDLEFKASLAHHRGAAGLIVGP